MAQFVIQLPFVSQNHLTYKFSLKNLLNEETKTVIKILIPQVIGLGVYNLNILINTQFASFMEDGSVTYLYLAERLLEFPLGIFAVSIATISLTQLSEFSNNKNLIKMSKYLNDRMAFLYFLLCPCCIIFIFWGDSICNLLYVRGEFTISDSLFTYKALIAYSIGLIFVGGVRLLTQAFFAVKDTATPVKLAMINLIVNAVLCYFFSIYLNFGFIGLALSSSISSILLFFSLLYSLRKNKINLKLNLFLKCLIFIFFSYAALFLSNYVIEILIFKSSILILFLKLLCFAIFYFLFSYFTNMRELKLIKE
jgi:putative peptidoglycan lipid II flippase